MICKKVTSEPIPHYLRMLTYARQPDDEWGPAKNENRFGRYEPKVEKSNLVDQIEIKDVDVDRYSTQDSENIFRIQL